MDYDVVKQLHDDDVIGAYDAAIVTKDLEGKIHVRKHETPTRRGAWGGAAIGAVVGVIFPPVLAAGTVGGASAFHVQPARAGRKRREACN